MRGLWLICALAACDDAVVLEVHPAPGVETTTVQLFIGLGACGSDCPGIQPRGAKLLLPGDVFYREDATTTVRTAPVEGGVARFRIEASEARDDFSLAVAVDEHGRSAAIIKSLPLDSAGRYRVDLIEANANGSALGPKPAVAEGNFVDIWQQPAGPLLCMGFEQWSDGQLKGRVFVVPEDDLDCDGRPNLNECAPYGYDASSIPTFAEATCTTSEPVSGTCWLGGSACDEVTGGTDACTPSDYCVPGSFCDALDTRCLGGDLEGCLFDSANASAKLKCSISFEPTAGGTHASPCANEFQLTLFPAASSSLECVSPTDGNKMLFEQPTAATREFVASVTYQTKDTNGNTYPLDLKLRYGFDGCTYKAYVAGDKAFQMAAPLPKRVFAQFWVTQSGGAINKLLVPIELSFTNDCGMPSTCTLVLDESLMNCAR